MAVCLCKTSAGLVPEDYTYPSGVEEDLDVIRRQERGTSRSVTKSRPVGPISPVSLDPVLVQSFFGSPNLLSGILISAVGGRLATP